MKKFSIAAIALLSLFAVLGCSSGPKYKDGTFHAEEAKFKGGYKYFVDVTVEKGKVTSVTWDAVAEDGGVNKLEKSLKGEYDMVAGGGAKAEWHVQAKAVVDHFMASQDTTIPDAITGATITYEPFYKLVNEVVVLVK